ncbi:MAG: hypothetical protein JNL41_02140 [Phenylobacterium sp.]|uniref:hypothetical protein n=1 Tax=Phenylobacterium sp. TaxID=1871053 RepID=UPI001A4DFF70|nr:hypothetical protein [Phenylobacterium sp.]MBL8553050.1 hypothetical protein [Phenylobacterium sp.]
MQNDDATLRTLLALRAQNQRIAGYHARQEIERLQAAAARDPKRLEPFGFKVYSQNDEDGIVEEIFRRLGIETGRFVEIGVQNGLECNSLYLLHKGWRGVWLEGNIGQRGPIESKFGEILGRRLQVGWGYISRDTINHVFRGMGADDDVDFLSIDIDGMDIYLLEALTSRPKVICIEYNAKWPAHLAKTPVYNGELRWTGTDYMGSSLKAMAEVAAAKGYRLVGTNLTGANAFFVRADLAADLFPDPATPEALHNPPRYWLWSDHYVNIGHRADFGPYVDLQAD